MRKGGSSLMRAEQDRIQLNEDPGVKEVRQGQVSVYGEGVKGPLLKSTDARLIQIRNRSGELLSVFVRLTGDIWGFVTRGDPDWEETIKRVEVKD